jgi:Anti-sigma-K factor rskA, C-terminal
MEHQEYKELLAISALDALDGTDALHLEAHLKTCVECRGEISELRDAAGLLAHGAPTQAPGEDLRARILSAARAESSPAKPFEKPSNVRPIASRKYGLPTNLLRIAAILLFAAVTVVLIIVLRVSEREIGNLTAAVEAQKAELNREREARLQDQKALALLMSRDAKMIQLAGTQTAQNARAMFVFDQKSGRAVLMTDGLPMTSTDKAYEVWFIPKGRSPMPGKTFTVDSSGHAMITDQVPSEAMNGAVIAITVEPKSGSAAPTGAIYLASPAS